jgi:hypothetical protein
VQQQQQFHPVMHLAQGAGSGRQIQGSTTIFGTTASTSADVISLHAWKAYFTRAAERWGTEFPLAGLYQLFGVPMPAAHLTGATAEGADGSSAAYLALASEALG